ncbi:MAG: GLPGLI family protein [Moheibacter sp.]
MKRILTLIVCGFCLTGFTQERLVVEYESIMEFDMAFFESKISETSGGNTKEIVNAFKDEMKKSKYYLLQLTPDESEFTYVEKINNDQPQEGRVRVEMGARGIFYKNLKDGITAETVNYPKEYILRDSIRQYDWKITRESKEILGYEVRKAEAVVDSTKALTAWYAPKLVYKNGPAEFGSLPGLILQLEETKDSEDEKATQIYTAISLKIVDEKKPIQFPKKGTIISKKDYQSIMDAEMKKMQDMYGGGVDTD